MNKEVLYYILLSGLSTLGIITNSVSFNPLRFHCDNFVLNTYLYFLLAWGIVLSTVTTLNNYNVSLSTLFASSKTILIFIGSLLVFIPLLLMPPKYFITKHILYLFFLILSGIMLYPFYVKNRNTFNHVGITTLLIFILLTFIAFAFPKMIKDSWGTYLFMALCGLLIARVTELIIIHFKPEMYSTKFNKKISYIAIIIFILYTLYDTKNILINSKNCVNPDYINGSLGIFLDSINLFQNMLNVSE
jgi:FtsH-binding integral membrane protein